MTVQFDTPILMIVFKRPDTTRVVFQKISELRPKRLFVSGNAPRPGNSADAVACEQVAQIFQDINWPCELITNFRSEHLSARNSISAGIDWFFGQVDEGIVLEDDCVPRQSFFKFCSLLLEKYRNNPRIMHIGGTNFQQGKRRGKADYYFSIYNHVWGWATWKRAWQKYDVDMKNYDHDETEAMLADKHSSRHFQTYWSEIFARTKARQIDTWDYQWTYAIWKNKGLSIIPQVNMVANIGFGPQATHTQSVNWQANLPAYELEIKVHPSIIELNMEADDYTSRVAYGIIIGRFSRIIWALRAKLKIRTRFKELCVYLGLVEK